MGATKKDFNKMRTEQEMILEMLKDNFRGTKSYTPKKKNTWKN